MERHLGMISHRSESTGSATCSLSVIGCYKSFIVDQDGSVVLEVDQTSDSIRQSLGKCQLDSEISIIPM